MKHSALVIAGRIRLMIATKQFQVGEVLPSTRDLGRQLEASFHTVRKAYHILADEGLVRSEQGRGFVVIRQATTLDKSQRLEIGATKLRALFEELIGYGLDEREIESLVDEQINFLDWPDRIQSSAAIGETVEFAGLLAEAIREQIGVRSQFITPDKVSDAVRYDAIFVPIHLYQSYRHLADSQLVLPVIYQFDPELLLSLADRLTPETIGLVTAEEQTIARMISDLKRAVRIESSFVAGATYGKSLPLFVRNTELILYTPACAALVEQKVPEKNRLRLRYRLSERSAGTIRSELWDQ
ncbi:MAG: GntR family transcriptional regulator [Balneolaceae bacterium]